MEFVYNDKLAFKIENGFGYKVLGILPLFLAIKIAFKF